MHRNTSLAASSLIAACLVVSLVGCSGGAGGVFTTPPPNPMSVSYTFEESNSARQLVATSGGSLSAAASDGTAYTLAIPADTLLADTEIVMTPIAGMQGFDLSGGQLAGVRLEPEGLRFHDFVTLTVTPASGSAAVPAAGFGSSGGGDEFHHHPLVLDPTVLSLELLHFSEALVYYGDNIHIPVAPEGFVPTDWEKQLVHLTEELIRNERNALLRGEEGDPEFLEKIETILRAFYDKVVGPLLPRIARDCDFAKANIGKALGWARQAALLLGEGAFAAETSEITSAVIAGLENCWREAVGECIDRSNPIQVSEVISIAKQLELLGAGAGHDPLDPALDCQVDTWVGTASQTNSGSLFTFEAVAEVTWRLDPEYPTGSSTKQYIPSGTLTVTITDVEGDSCVYAASHTMPIVVETAAGRNNLQIDYTNDPPAYHGNGGDVTVSRECDFGDSTFQVGTFSWFSISGDGGYTVSSDGSTISGTRTDSDTVWEWSFALEAPSE
jgi:hypothetical protein